jgi:hypothetical protein
MALPAIQVHSREAWDARAQQLCDAAQLRYTSRLIAERAGVEYFTVPSRDRSSSHVVEYHMATGHLAGDCIAGSYAKPCCHAGTVLYYLAQRAQAYTAAEISAAARYHRTWED